MKGSGNKLQHIEISNLITLKEVSVLLTKLESRFNNNMHRHNGVLWENIQKLLESNSDLIKTVYAMESTGGEPDVVMFSDSTELFFVDCSSETPEARRSITY